MKRTLTATFAVLALGSLSACGGGSDFAEGDAADIVAASQKAMGEVTSLRAAGEIIENDETTELDLTLDDTGNCTGSISLAGSTVEILAVDGSSWMKGDEKFWTGQDPSGQGPAIAAAVGDKWVAAPEGSGLADVCDLEELIGADDSDDDDKDYEKLEVEDIDGTDAIGIRSTDEDGESSIGYVRVDGDHHLLRVEREGEKSGTMNFSQFDEKLDVSAPDPADVADLSALGG